MSMVVTSAGLVFLASAIFERVGRLDVAGLGGLATRMPRMAALFVFLSMSSISLPGTSGFAAELLLLVAAFHWHPALAAVGLVAVVFSAIAMLRYIERAIFGAPRADSAWLPDLRPREWFAAGATALLALLIGLQPDVFLHKSKTTTALLEARLAEARATHVERVVIDDEMTVHPLFFALDEGMRTMTCDHEHEMRGACDEIVVD
jgi:NADH-quinone oxidoreductase subunit M